MAFMASAEPSESTETLFIRARQIPYVKDGPVDHWQTPEKTQERFAGDCEDKAIWLIDRLVRAGHTDLVLAVGRKSPRDKGLHVWVEQTGHDGRRLLLDPTAQRRIWDRRDLRSGTYHAIFSYSPSTPASRA